MAPRRRPLGRNNRIATQRDEIAQYIRAGTLSHSAIAERFGVNRRTVIRIAGREAEKGVTFELAKGPEKGSQGSLGLGAPSDLKRSHPATACGVCTSADLARSSCPHHGQAVPTLAELDRFYEKYGRRHPTYRDALRQWATGTPPPDTLAAERAAFDRLCERRLAAIAQS